MTKKIENKSGNWGGSYDANVYYHPESCGLRIVASVEKEPDWDFDIVVLFKDTSTGSLWLCADSGCSCPTPFEDVRSFSDMTRVQSETGIENFLAGYWTDSYRPEEIRDFKKKARVAVRTWKKSRASK